MNHELLIKALRTQQGANLDVYLFFMRGADVTRIADISRIERSDTDSLKGFQRPEIKSHVKSIVDYLNQGQVIFPNAIILAMSPEVKFLMARGPKPEGLIDISQSGTLSIPIYEEGQRVAWIVDGQQRSIALSHANNSDLPVPVVAFISDDLEIQREQFILVNKARPLPPRLINELLPETRSILLPRDLSSRKMPSELCKLLNRDSSSPFYKLIKRISEANSDTAVITDTAVIKMIRNSLNSPLGALAPYKAGINENADLESMYQILMTFWTAVKEAFPLAWGLDPRQSRLMHSAGVEAMGVLMDRIWVRHAGSADISKVIKHELAEMAPKCAWVSGTWDSLGVEWNEIQNTTRDIKRLEDALVRIYTNSVRK